MTQRAVIYGGSLYELAVEENRAAQILEELTEVFKLFRENPDYLTLLLEPSIKKDKRLELIEEAFGSSCDRYLVNFLKLLCERGLLREFEGCR
ncbi:MAG: F0F1 ATP synthase subunit delta, partial [Lachnospiraceae bacterium]|nr:F0F1 ATP synthase subunit delta [Lachnospiraceae bacterium]